VTTYDESSARLDREFEARLRRFDVAEKRKDRARLARRTDGARSTQVLTILHLTGAVPISTLARCMPDASRGAVLTQLVTMERRGLVVYRRGRPATVEIRPVRIPHTAPVLATMALRRSSASEAE